jgi:hypothetical protein
MNKEIRIGNALNYSTFRATIFSVRASIKWVPGHKLVPGLHFDHEFPSRTELVGKLEDAGFFWYSIAAFATILTRLEGRTKPADQGE